MDHMQMVAECVQKGLPTEHRQTAAKFICGGCQGTAVVGPTLQVSEPHNLNKGSASELAHMV
jgi:hypothetical protein